jgi:hypothetical protein
MGFLEPLEELWGPITTNPDYGMHDWEDEDDE